MITKSLDRQINQFLPLLGNDEKKSLLVVIKSFLNLKNAQTVGVVEDLPKLDENEDIKEHEIVVTTTKIANISKGTRGTVVHIYANGEAYEVEFIVGGKSIVETALRNQIEKK